MYSNTNSNTILNKNYTSTAPNTNLIDSSTNIKQFESSRDKNLNNFNYLNHLEQNDNTCPITPVKNKENDANLSYGNGPWMNGPLLSPKNTPENHSSGSEGFETFTTPINNTNDTSPNSSPSESECIDNASQSPLAFNGNTYVRPNKKERKGLYFSTSNSDGGTSGSSTPEIQGSTSVPGGAGSHPGDNKKTSLATSTNTNKTDVMDGEDDDTNAINTNTNGTSCGNINKTAKIIPSLKFSSPRTSSTSASISTDEDTLDLVNESEKDQKLISFHKMTNRNGSPSTKNFNSNNNHNNTQGSSVSSTASSTTLVPKSPKIPKIPNKSPEVGAEGLGDLLGINNLSPIARSATGSKGVEVLTTSTPSSTKSSKHLDDSYSGSGGLNFNNHVRHNDLDSQLQPQQHNHSHSLSNTSTEENFECFGEGSESFSILDSTNTTESNSLQNFRDLNESDILSSSGAGDGIPPPSLSRQGWQRNSLRRTPNPNNLNGDGMNHRRWGSFRTSSKRGVPVVPSSKALANELYRSSSYHSSGRSSAGDGEEMYSDSSLEGEVIDLTKKVHHLEEKFTVLAENQNDVDDRYTRAKQENAELSTKLFMFEEQLREVELRADEKLREEQRRHKEALSRFEREKQLQIENYEIKSQMLEKDFASAKIDVKRLEGTLERERNEKNRLADKYANVEREISSVRDQNRELLNQNRIDRETMAMESAGSQQALVELKKQLEGLSHFHLNSSSNSFRRNDSTESESSELKSRLREADEEIRRLKHHNKQLQETNEELSAQILNQGLENGRILLKELNTSGGAGGNSLAAEFEAMSMEEMKAALKDQKEANLALRSYIDGILLNIVEHYPQLLEVKNKNTTNHNGKMASESK